MSRWIRRDGAIGQQLWEPELCQPNWRLLTFVQSTANQVGLNLRKAHSDAVRLERSECEGPESLCSNVDQTIPSRARDEHLSGCGRKGRMRIRDNETRQHRCLRPGHLDAGVRRSGDPRSGRIPIDKILRAKLREVPERRRRNGQLGVP